MTDLKDAWVNELSSRSDDIIGSVTLRHKYDYFNLVLDQRTEFILDKFGDESS